MQGLQYKCLSTGETSAMRNSQRNESLHCLAEAEDDSESHKYKIRGYIIISNFQGQNMIVHAKH